MFPIPAPRLAASVVPCIENPAAQVVHLPHPNRRPLWQAGHASKAHNFPDRQAAFRDPGTSSGGPRSEVRPAYGRISSLTVSASSVAYPEPVHGGAEQARRNGFRWDYPVPCDEQRPGHSRIGQREQL
ncbi:hypothetical protein S7711_10792 [Stachybotrys chartarum IBT 7711]|uniref:Uncharacterized protein n=1 Tax=Stachybotrys chartarum (strain CBS 109288 / IBT 7711) TaxID=1280523 RepID=A0A084AQW0_STACB|nr:hypothetical protein S7711_10792 [Stachybotrys chartarum IBT 7711]